MTNNDADQSVTPDVACRFFNGTEWHAETVPVPAEKALTIFINGVETVTVQCTPAKLNQLVVGFLYMQGVIDSVKEIAMLRVCEEEPIADVRLTKTDYALPPRRTLTSGCGSGITAKIASKPVVSDLVVTPQEVLALMKQLYQRQELFRQAGGIHSSALCDRNQVLVQAEDIGRHNTIDKIMGECLLRSLPTRDKLLLTTGRTSSDMLLKAARMQAPVIASRGSPTRLAVELGEELGVTIIGYARQERLSVFSHAERVR